MRRSLPPPIAIPVVDKRDLPSTFHTSPASASASTSSRSPPPEPAPRSHSHSHSHAHSHHSHPHRPPLAASPPMALARPRPQRTRSAKKPARTYSSSSWDGTSIFDMACKEPCGGTALGSNVKGPCKPIGRTDGVIICWWCCRWLGTFETWSPPRKPPPFKSVYDSEEDLRDGFYA